MPHVVIKMIKGPSIEEQKKAAEQIREIIESTLGKPQKYTSVAIEEYSLSEWEGVYNEQIKDNDCVILKPGYKNPKTFQ